MEKRLILIQSKIYFYIALKKIYLQSFILKIQMKKIVYLLLLLCFSLISNAQSIDSAFATKINCYQDTGFVNVFCSYCDTTPSISYEWYDTTGGVGFVNVLSINQDFTDLSCGVRTLIVSENNIPFDTISKFIGCPITIGLGSNPIPCVGGVGDVKRSVFGGAKFDPNGSIDSLGIEDGDEYYKYIWYSADDTLGTNSVLLPDTIEILVAVPAGFYKVIVEDAIGCKDSIDHKEFKDPVALIFQNILLDSIVCNGDVTTLEIQVKGGKKHIGGLGYSFYIIQNNDTISFANPTNQSTNFNVLATSSVYWKADTVSINLFASTDSFQIVVIDSMGCVLDSTIFIPQPDSIVAQIYTNTYPLCSYDSTWIYLDTIFGGVDPYSYQWTNGTNIDSIFVAGGFNRVYVIDNNGCTDSTNGINVISPQEISVTDSIINIKCFGDSTGQVYLQTSGGTGAISIDWGFGVNPMALSVGNYPVIINDNLGCSFPNPSYTITENPLINISFTKRNPTCLNHANGNIQLNVSGGVPPYNYQWNNGIIIDSIGGLQVGNYAIEVTDSLGCILMDSVELQSTDSLIISFANYTANLSCFGELTTITANISGGTTFNGNYTILWNNGDTSNQTILGGGTHQILVSDDVGCEDSATVFIYTPDSLSISATSIDPSCLGNDGSISLNVSGGVPPYNYQWSSGETTSSVPNLTAGTYWVFVSDSCGNDTLEITLNPYISTLSIDNFILTQPSCSNDDGSIDIIVSGGFPIYTYLWSNGATTEDLSAAGYGNYTVLVTDNCGLTTSATYTLNQQQNTVSAIGFYDYLSLWSTVNASGTNPPFSVEWASIAMFGDSIKGLCEGNYPITVTDSENCEDTLSIDVLYNVNQLVDAATSTVIDSSWGIGPFSYLWSNGQTTPHADSLCAGNHSVIVTALGGPYDCEYSESFNISELTAILTPSAIIIDCDDKDFDGDLTIDPDGSTPPYRFLWSTGDTINRLENNLNPGTYSVSVFDKNGCRLDTSIKILEMGASCLPNVFSPNGDGKNDVWELDDAFLYSESTITIYGRFGKKMYESVGYDTPWDGTNKKGNDVPDGAYFYVITLKGGADPIRGTITVIR